MVMPDKTVICKSVGHPLGNDCAVGGVLTIVRPTDDGTCIIPAKITGIGERGEIITLLPSGKPQRVQKRVFTRVRVDTGVQLKLQFDSSNSRYKSMKVHDIGGGGVGVTIYAKNPIETGQLVRLDIELAMRKYKISARGEVIHCTLLNPNAREFLLGIKFIEISERDQLKIIEFVEDEYQKQEAERMRKEELKQKEMIVIGGANNPQDSEHPHAQKQGAQAAQNSPQSATQDPQSQDQSGQVTSTAGQDSKNDQEDKSENRQQSAPQEPEKKAG